MTRVDFAYGASHRLNMACQTTARHVRAGHNIAIYCTDAKRLKRFDHMLWDFEPTSFISHCLINDPMAKYAQVLLIHNPSDIELLNNKEWLLNLDQDIPANAGNFKRVLEIISSKEDEVLNARQRWQQYKKLGFMVKGHKI